MGDNYNDDDQVIYTMKMAPPRPFLVPSFDGEPVEVLPSEKPNQRIKWDTHVEILEIPPRDKPEGEEEDESEHSYEIEIVEDDGEADFYLEIVDGEIFYVFETEDDISVDEEDEDDDMDESESERGDGSERPHLQLPIASMLAPSLDHDNDAEDTPMFAPISSTDAAMQNLSTAPSAAEPEKSFERMNIIEDMPKDIPVHDKHHHRDRSGSFDTELATAVSGDDDLVSTDGDDIASIVPEKEAAATPTVVSTENDANQPSEIDLHTPVTSPMPPPDKSKVSVSGFTPHPPASPPNVPSQPPQTSVSPSEGSSPRRTSILKACPPSPRRKLQKKPKKGEKTFTKTYVRAHTFDGEHQVFSWEKPDWAKQSQLKATGKMEQLQKTGNLAKPITSAPHIKPKNDHLLDDKGNEIDQEELVRRINAGDRSAMSLVPLPTYMGKQRKMKLSVTGAKLREGGNLAKPITMATQLRQKDDTNLLGNKETLKNKGVQPQHKKYEWEQPEWAKAKLLKPTGAKDQLERGIDLAPPITHLPEEIKKKYEWEKPEWTRRSLKSTGASLLDGHDLAKPITELPSLAKKGSH